MKIKKSKIKINENAPEELQRSVKIQYSDSKFQKKSNQITQNPKNAQNDSKCKPNRKIANQLLQQMKKKMKKGEKRLIQI